MFVIELTSGLLAKSTALLSDSLDNLGDALTYGLSLYAVSRGAKIEGDGRTFQRRLITLAGLFVLGQSSTGYFHPTVPVFETMGVVSIVALAANGACLMLLWKHRREDINMSSVWECSRNDIASNLSVLLAAAGVWAHRVGLARPAGRFLARHSCSSGPPARCLQEPSGSYGIQGQASPSGQLREVA